MMESSVPMIVVRTLRGDLFEFPHGTTEQDMRNHVADSLGVDRALLLLRSFRSDVAASSASLEDHTTEDQKTEDQKTDESPVSVYLALVEAHRDTSAWFIYQSAASEQNLRDHEYTGSVYRVGCAAPHLPPNFYLGYIAAEGNWSDHDEFRWSVEDPPRFPGRTDGPADLSDQEEDPYAAAAAAPTWPTVRACIENYCEVTGWPLPCLLFLEQVDARFKLYERLTAIRECGWRVGSVYHIFGCRRRVLATLRRLQTIDPSINWVAKAHAPRAFRSRGEFSLADPQTYLEIVMGFPREEAEEFGLYARWWC